MNNAMICIKCNADIPEGSTYCNMCGQKQTVQTSVRKPKSRGNGQGSVFSVTTRSGKVKYRAEVVLGYYMASDGKLKKRTVSREFERKKDAVLTLPELMRHKGTLPLHVPNLMELHDTYMNGHEYKHLSKSQQDKLSYAWKRLSPLHMRKIDTLTVPDMQCTIDAATDTYYPARDMKVMLSHLYEIAIKHEYVQYNKTEWIDLPSKSDKLPEALNTDEIQLLWDDYNSTSDTITGYILIMIYAGLRYGELAGLLKENIHLDAEYPYMVGGEKTEAGRNREIPIIEKIEPIVRTMYDRCDVKLLEMSEDTFRKAYWAKIDSLGIRHLPPQICRHTYFSLLTAAGIAPGIITKTGGHTDYRTTLKHYVKLSIKDKYDALNNV